MTIIELAEKQLKNEILPKHIRYKNEDLYLNGASYYDEQGNNDLLDILAMENSAITHLNDEVEIIEEDKKIEKIITLSGYDSSSMHRHYEKINEVCNKFNELIDVVNELKKEGK